MIVVTVFFFNDTATTEIYTLSLHDALPIYRSAMQRVERRHAVLGRLHDHLVAHTVRSEEHTSELQSRSDLVCRLLLEKKKATDHMSRAIRPVVAAPVLPGRKSLAFRKHCAR